jgi:hypothetical protein
LIFPTQSKETIGLSISTRLVFWECKCSGCLVPKPSAGPNAPSVRRICPSAAPNVHIPWCYGAPNDRSTCTYVHLASVVIRQLGPAIICDIPV